MSKSFNKGHVSVEGRQSAAVPVACCSWHTLSGQMEIISIEGGRSAEVSEHRHSRTTQPLCHKWVQFVDAAAAVAVAGGSNRGRLSQQDLIIATQRTAHSRGKPARARLRAPDVHMASSSCEVRARSLCSWGGGRPITYCVSVCMVCAHMQGRLHLDHRRGYDLTRRNPVFTHKHYCPCKALLFRGTLNTLFALLHSPQWLPCVSHLWPICILPVFKSLSGHLGLPLVAWDFKLFCPCPKCASNLERGPSHAYFCMFFVFFNKPWSCGWLWGIILGRATAN